MYVRAISLFCIQASYIYYVPNRKGSLYLNWILTTKLMWTLCSDVEGACFKVVKRAWTKSLCSLEGFFFLDLFSNFFLEECSSLIPFCFPLFIMLKVMMTIRDAYLLSGPQWGDILFEREFLLHSCKAISQF